MNLIVNIFKLNKIVTIEKLVKLVIPVMLTYDLILIVST